MAVCAERRRSGKLNGRGRSPECSKDMNKPSAKANFICILPRRVLSSTKIAKAESNYENLFLKIAEPHPVFYKDSQSRENTKIYFRRPGRPDYSDGCEMCVNSMRIGGILRRISGFFTIFVSRNDEGVPFVPFVRLGIVGALPVLWMFSGFSARRSVRFRITTEDIRNDASSVYRAPVRIRMVRDRMAEKFRIEADSGFQV